MTDALGSTESQDLQTLTVADLAKIQRTLERHAARRDPSNIVAIGFGPKVRDNVPGGTPSARYMVRQKRSTVPDRKRIPEIKTVRLLDPRQKAYRRVRIETDVVQVAPAEPAGVRASFGRLSATAAAVVRWTTERPLPKPLREGEPPSDEDAPGSPWRWGLMSVAHAVERRSVHARVARAVTCGDVPLEIRGRVVAMGRVPGGPDVSLVETGLDRLWLSGLLPRPDSPFLPTTSDRDVLRWIRGGGHGYIHADRRVGRWRFETYFPTQTIVELGRLRGIIQFASVDPDDPPRPYAPGSSGSMLVEGGVPVGLQVAASPPDFVTAYAQLNSILLPWIAKTLKATALGIVHVV